MKPSKSRPHKLLVHREVVRALRVLPAAPLAEVRGGSYIVCWPPRTQSSVDAECVSVG